MADRQLTENITDGQRRMLEALCQRHGYDSIEQAAQASISADLRRRGERAGVPRVPRLVRRR